MPLQLTGQTGPQTVGDGAQIPFRQGRAGDQIVSELHGRFYEQNYRAALFTGGMTLTSINAATFTSATTGVTATPVVGIYNPQTSKVNCVILQAVLGITVTALASTGGGPFVWMVSTQNNAVSTGAAPFSTLTLTQNGSQVKNVAGVALTGMTGTLAVVRASALFGGSFTNQSFTATAAGMQTTQFSSVENLDGSLIVPPGGVLALMATTTPVAHSATSGLLWEEVPV